jgi:hypothetical protein
MQPPSFAQPASAESTPPATPRRSSGTDSAHAAAAPTSTGYTYGLKPTGVVEGKSGTMGTQTGKTLEQPRMQQQMGASASAATVVHGTAGAQNDFGDVRDTFGAFDLSVAGLSDSSSSSDESGSHKSLPDLETAMPSLAANDSDSEREDDSDGECDLDDDDEHDSSDSSASSFGTDAHAARTKRAADIEQAIPLPRRLRIDVLNPATWTNTRKPWFRPQSQDFDGHLVLFRRGMVGGEHDLVGGHESPVVVAPTGQPQRSSLAGLASAATDEPGRQRHERGTSSTKSCR